MMASPKTTLKSLIARCDTSNGPDSCWIWQGYVSNRYGVISIENRPVRSNRAVWMLRFGPIPSGIHVCHRCDVPLCCNPAHLFLGTPDDNNEDKVSKGRQTFGESVAGSILTAAQAGEIKISLASAKRGTGINLSRKYGVSPSTISAIKHGRIWSSRTQTNALGM